MCRATRPKEEGRIAIVTNAAVSDFVVGLYGVEHRYEIGSLIIALRFDVRQELGLPV